MDAENAPKEGESLTRLLERLLRECLTLWGIDAAIATRDGRIEVTTRSASVSIRLDPSRPVAHWWIAVSDSGRARERPAPSVLGVLSAVRRHLEGPRNG
jgi:hypothetical protein